MLDDADLVRGAAVHPQKQLSRCLCHHDHTLRLLAQGGQHFALVIRRLRKDGVKRQDERSRELPRERQHVLAVGAAEDPVLVLQQDDVDVESTQQPCCSDVVAPHCLRHGREDIVALRARRLVDDGDRAHALHARGREQRCADVEGERSDPARARRVRREDRSTHGSVRPFQQVSGVPALNRRKPGRVATHATRSAHDPRCRCQERSGSAGPMDTSPSRSTETTWRGSEPGLRRRPRSERRRSGGPMIACVCV